MGLGLAALLKEDERVAESNVVGHVLLQLQNELLEFNTRHS